MKKFFELGNEYAKQSDWKDFALTKFCLCAIGVIIGLLIPKDLKSIVLTIAIIIFIITYIPLMTKVFKIFKQMNK